MAVLKIGAKYQWKHNKNTTLIYLGYNWSGNGFWHQFSKESEPDKIWCELLGEDLHMIEKVKNA